jgi:damage-control phosphatase, subfamily II, stand-alone protein
MVSAFCKLADPAGYVPCSLDLVADEASRQYWVDLFKRHLPMVLDLARASADVRTSVRAELWARLDALLADPPSHGRVTILTLDRWRTAVLHRHCILDAFSELKERENAKALPLLPVVCAELDRLAGTEQIEAVVRGVLAGNIFDMGAEAVAQAFLADGHDFFELRGRIRGRPWLVDDYTQFARRMLDGAVHRKAVFFVDNAGADFILGAVPMMRWLARRGTAVVLAANERPTLNDMTLREVNEWWPRIVAAEPSLAALPIERVSTGNGEALIDLQEVSPELNRAAADADLVILEGMGRGIESNFEARFSCDALNVAMIKDAAVAARLGGEVYDVVCRFR